MITQFSFWYLLLYTMVNPPDSGTLELTIQNIQKESGTIKIALYNSPDDFPKETKTYKAGEIKAQKPQVKYTFKNIPDGDYAIAVFHDVNSDEELNFKMFFIPNEPYGFSNDFVPRFSKPKFDDARFTVKGDTAVKIKLID